MVWRRSAVLSAGNAATFRTQRKPAFAARWNGGSPPGSKYSLVVVLNPPPRMYRAPPPDSFRHHSATLPAMSYVPNGPTPWYLPTGEGEAEKLLSGMMYLATALGAARNHCAITGKL